MTNTSEQRLTDPGPTSTANDLSDQKLDRDAGDAGLAGTPSDGPDVGQGDGQGDDDSSNDFTPAPRGFFGRLVAALSPGDGSDDASPTARTQMAMPAPGMLNLRRMRVEDVAIPKSDIVAVPITYGRDELVAVFRAAGLTRLPVFDGTLDTPVGFVNLKDFALRYGFGDDSAIDLAALVRPLLYVPPSMPLGVLLQKMQAERTHMALVIDEYGGTDGLLTIEDLIEQVVGEIEDEHDVEEAAGISLESVGVWVALAKASLEEVELAIGCDLTATKEVDEEEVDTLGGLVIMLAGHVPARGEIIRHPDGPEFEVIEADPRRIKRVRLRLTPDLNKGEVRAAVPKAAGSQ